MKPIKLTLEGFKGISSGLGKNAVTLDLEAIPLTAKLIALSGPNGAGKTTLMDNLHPYRVMPSHSSTLGPGGFSYWDHIHRPAAKKEFFWNHKQRKFQTLFNFRSSGKTSKADYYLLEWDQTDAKWNPVTIPDGTTSDGKAETYDACVNALLGNPETFFTSMFACQNRKMMSSYSAGDIKNVLSSILDQNYLQALERKANEVLKLLRFRLAGLQENLAQARTADAGILETTNEVARLNAVLLARTDIESRAVAVLDETRKALSALEAERDARVKVVEERAFLTQQVEKVKCNANNARLALKAHCEAEVQRIAAEREKLDNACFEIVGTTATIDGEAKRLSDLIIQKEAVDRACLTFDETTKGIATIDQALMDIQIHLRELKSKRTDLDRDVLALENLKTNGAAQTERINVVTDTASLAERVPCAGSRLQAKCPLLTSAIEARTSLPTLETTRKEMRDRYQSTNIRVAGLRPEVRKIEGLEATINEKTIQRNHLSVQLQQAAKKCGLVAPIADAEARLPQLIESKRLNAAKLVEVTERLSKIGGEINEIRKSESIQVAVIEKQESTEIQEFQSRLDTLALPISPDAIDAATVAVKKAMLNHENERATTQINRDELAQMNARLQALMHLRTQVARSVAEANALSGEIAKWRLIEKALGNDGLVALAIDDVGPEIARLCNMLLNDCYGGRFAVRLNTQRETQSGSVREVFDILVQDRERGDGEKSLTRMSGGETVWVNDCLTRAIALHISHTSGKEYHTLFSDESDGPLDEGRKRHFIAVKRAVLERGGYEREFYVSQIRELVSLADHVIDVAAL